MYSTLEKQLDLLAKVLAAGDAEAGEEVLPEDEDDVMTRGGGGAHVGVKAKRTVGNTLAISGADGAYLEFASGGGGGGNGGGFNRFGRGASGFNRPPRSIKPRNSILRDRDVAMGFAKPSRR